MPNFRRRCVILVGMLFSHCFVGIFVSLWMMPTHHCHTEKYKIPVNLKVTPRTSLLKPSLYKCNCPSYTLPKDATIFVITPTYTRPTQKADLTALCQTLSLSGKIVWIVIEDAALKTKLVQRLLSNCHVESVHLAIPTPNNQKQKWWEWTNSWHHRGVNQRNFGLKWLRLKYSIKNCEGVVYFADDDNRYDRRLFEMMRKTRKLSAWPVGFIDHLSYEGPICFNNSVIKWRARQHSIRLFPIDMAGFAIHLCQFFEHPQAELNSSAPLGQLENSFLMNFINKRSDVECRGSSKEVMVWHVKTRNPDLSLENREPPSHFLET